MATRLWLTIEAKMRRWKYWILLVIFVVVTYECLNSYYPAMGKVHVTAVTAKNMFRDKFPRFKIDERRQPSRKELANFVVTMPPGPKVRTKYRPYCKTMILRGSTTVNVNYKNVTVFDNLKNQFPMVSIGGRYKPSNCRSKQKVAILVPYRDRQMNLKIFLLNIHPFLIPQQLEYQIFVIEQYGTDPFNKGRLFNAGFKESQKHGEFNCLVFHDVDLLPLNKEIQYLCTPMPRHLCVTKQKLMMKNETLFNKTAREYADYFGSVTSMKVDQFLRTNGFSNLYYGGGGEGNDMHSRLQAAGYKVIRYDKTVGVYAILPHKPSPLNENRYYLMARAIDRYKVDGLSNMEYKLISRENYPLFTHIYVDINPYKNNVSALNEKWLNGHSSIK